ncbi:hypothetical protein D3C77_514170 [compost metagenome]
MPSISLENRASCSTNLAERPPENPTNLGLPLPPTAYTVSAVFSMLDIFSVSILTFSFPVSISKNDAVATSRTAHLFVTAIKKFLLINNFCPIDFLHINLFCIDIAGINASDDAVVMIDIFKPVIAVIELINT